MVRYLVLFFFLAFGVMNAFAGGPVLEEGVPMKGATDKRAPEGFPRDEGVPMKQGEAPEGVPMKQGEAPEGVPMKQGGEGIPAPLNKDEGVPMNPEAPPPEGIQIPLPR